MSATDSIAPSRSTTGPILRRRRDYRPLVQRVVAPAILAALIIAVWQAAASAGLIDPFFLPAPFDIADRLIADITGPALSYLQPTVVAATIGSFVALLVALPLAISIALSRLARDTTEPFIAASQALPAVAVAPLLVLWFGYGLMPVVVLCALIVFFPILVASTQGLTHVDADVIDAAKLDGASTLNALWRIQMPLAAPSILAGVRTGFTLSLTGAIVGEIVTGGQGMGVLLTTRAAAADTTGLFASLTVTCAIAVTVFAVIGVIQNRLIYLREGTQ